MDDNAIVYLGFIGTQRTFSVENKKGRGTKEKLKEILECQALKVIEKL